MSACNYAGEELVTAGECSPPDGGNCANYAAFYCCARGGGTDECSENVSIPIIGNGDISSGRDVEHRRDTTGVSGIMIGGDLTLLLLFRCRRRLLLRGSS